MDNCLPEKSVSGTVPRNFQPAAIVALAAAPPPLLSLVVLALLPSSTQTKLKTPDVRLPLIYQHAHLSVLL
jgi:hypothetical protein